MKTQALHLHFFSRTSFRILNWLKMDSSFIEQVKCTKNRGRQTVALGPIVGLSALFIRSRNTYCCGLRGIYELLSCAGCVGSRHELM